MKRAEEAKLLEEKVRRLKQNKLKRLYEAMYDWQHRFNAATSSNRACALIAANQVGKSRTACIIDAYHLTGDYPDDWTGYAYGFPPLVWILGYSMEKTRDLLQYKLFGRLKDGEFEGGYIPADRIIDYRSSAGTSGACREVRVRHKTGGVSVCQFWSYSQGQHALMGDVVDWYHIDEEPEDQEIFPQVLTRTLNGDQGRGGRGILTFTPENGKTELVCRFMDEPEEGMYMQTATWDEAPHLDEETKRQILSAYPPYQREMRSKGVPLMGSGLIFPIDQDRIAVDPFQVPEYWFILNGIDFGWDHPQAIVQAVWDRDSDVIYIVNAWKESNRQPYEAWHITKPWVDGVPTTWPRDGLQTRQQIGKQDAVRQKTMYEDEGFWMLEEPSCFPDGSVGVWAGIMEMRDRMETGRLKIFSNLFQVYEEIREYHTKTLPSGNVEIVKVKDDIIDASRYLIMSLRHAIRIADINLSREEFYHLYEKPEPGAYDNF